MTAAPAIVSDMLVTVKSREVQRAMTAEQRGERDAAALHFLAAAQLELVLAADYENIDEIGLARRSRISAASCYWRAGETSKANQLFDELRSENPCEIDTLIGELGQRNPVNGCN